MLCTFKNANILIYSYVHICISLKRKNNKGKDQGRATKYELNKRVLQY